MFEAMRVPPNRSVTTSEACAIASRIDGLRRAGVSLVRVVAKANTSACVTVVKARMRCR